MLSACLGAAGLALVRAEPPAPRQQGAPGEVFSALRARDRLAALLADEAPHPVGSAAAAALRARLVAQLRELGLTPEELPGFACSELGSCAPVVNVLVRVPGREPGPAVLLASHYDSVAAGPGAADDGHGVAVVLETLRALLADGPARAPLLAVFTDGEEASLLGARTFVEHPAFAEVGVVLNIEARGTGGAARMFETSDGNAHLIAAYAAGAPRPSAHSLSYEIYRRLPNDTDLTIFKQAGAQGLGFAFIGGVRRYHTPLDDLAHLDLGSVQQQGDSVLGATRALLAAGPRPAAGNTTYADLFGLVVLRWPAALDLPLAGLALVMLLFACWRAVRPRGASEPLRARAIALAVGSVVLTPVLAAAVGFGLLWLVARLSGPIGAWPAALELGLATAAAAASAIAALSYGLVTYKIGARAQALGVWLLWALLGLLVAWLLPGASILLIAPALSAGLGLLAAGDHAGLRAAACAGAGALACALWAPLIPALVDALGLDALVAGGLVGWTWSAASPALADRGSDRRALRLAVVLALAAAPLAVMLGRAPRIDSERPGKLNIMHVQDLDSGAASHVLDAEDGLPPELAALAVPWTAGTPLPWSTRTMFTAPAPASPADPAEGPRFVRRTSEPAGELRRITGTLYARPGALQLVLMIPGPSIASLRIGGRALDLEKVRHGREDSRIITIEGVPAAGVELEAEVRGDTPWLLGDAIAGLPTSAAELQGARPEHRVAYQMGDRQISFRQLVP